MAKYQIAARPREVDATARIELGLDTGRASVPDKIFGYIDCYAPLTSTEKLCCCRKPLQEEYVAFSRL